MVHVPMQARLQTARVIARRPVSAHGRPKDKPEDGHEIGHSVCNCTHLSRSGMRERRSDAGAGTRGRRDRVRLEGRDARAGTFKPSDTTHTGEVDAGPGQTGILLGGMEHPSALTQVALVRFVPQAWRDLASGAQVELGEFEATIHSEYLDVQK
jgi:hypothetical protein